MSIDDYQWYFSKEQMANSPSRKCGISEEKEQICRHQTANFIQDMGQRLSLTQLCINTAIVYMHRFYMNHSLSKYPWYLLAPATIFLSSKAEESPRPMAHVISAAYACLHRKAPALDKKSDSYKEQEKALVKYEIHLLEGLGFDVIVEHPHVYIIKYCKLANVEKNCARIAYFMASNSLHTTTMCVQYKPAVVACFCIYVASQWTNWTIPRNKEGKHWFSDVDPTMTSALLERVSKEFRSSFDRSYSYLWRKIKNVAAFRRPCNMNLYAPIEPYNVQAPANNSKANDVKKEHESYHYSHKQVPSSSNSQMLTHQQTLPKNSNSKMVNQNSQQRSLFKMPTHKPVQKYESSGVNVSRDRALYNSFGSTCSNVDRNSSIHSRNLKPNDKKDTNLQRANSAPIMTNKPAPAPIPPRPRAEIIRERFAEMMLKKPDRHQQFPPRPPIFKASSIQNIPSTVAARVTNVDKATLTNERSRDAPDSALQNRQVPQSDCAHAQAAKNTEKSFIEILNKNVESAKAEEELQNRGKPKQINPLVLMTPPKPSKMHGLAPLQPQQSKVTSHFSLDLSTSPPRKKSKARSLFSPDRHEQPQPKHSKMKSTSNLDRSTSQLQKKSETRSLFSPDRPAPPQPKPSKMKSTSSLDRSTSQPQKISKDGSLLYPVQSLPSSSKQSKRRSLFSPDRTASPPSKLLKTSSIFDSDQPALYF